MNNDNGNSLILLKYYLKRKGNKQKKHVLHVLFGITGKYKRSKGNMKTVTAEAKTHLGSDIIFVVLPVQIATMDLNGAQPINRIANTLSHVNVTISHFYL